MTGCIYVYYFVDCHMYTKEIKFKLNYKVHDNKESNRGPLIRSLESM